jgi:hypothetical protein
MLRRVALVRTEDSEELSASFIRVTRIVVLITTPYVTSNRRKLRRTSQLASVLVTAGVVPSSRLVVLRSVRRLLVTAGFVPSSPILVTLMKEALSSPKRRSYKSHTA